jgi:ankyrin repeat protein
VKHLIPTRRLPERPDLDQLKRQAKELLAAFAAGEAEAAAEVNRSYRDPDPAQFALHDAQLVLARSYGFDSWPKLKAYVEGVTIGRLTEAVRAGDVEQVRALLRIRPELVKWEAPSSQGHMALHYAVLGRMPEMVRVLMQSGADPHAGTAGIYALREAAAPLAIAVERGYDEIAAIIREEERRREAGRPTATDRSAELHQAFETGDEDRAIDLLKQHPEMIQERLAGNRWTLLHLASALLLPRVAGWLLDGGADVNGRTGDGASPLDVVGLRRKPVGRGEAMRGMARLLCGRGAEQTARSAVIFGDAAALRRRAEQEDLITPRDDRGWLLRLAVDCDRPEILELLLDLGLDPDARVRVDGEDQITFTWGMPLYQCTRYGKQAMAELLLQRRADPNGHVYASGTPLSEAYGQRDDRMIALLERYGGKSTASMAGLYRRGDLARRLLEEFGDASLPDDGFSKGPVAEQLLGAAARGGDPEILRLAMDRVNVPHGDPRWSGLLQGPLEFWNHWVGPWCHPEWDRGTYLTCFKMILEKSGPPNRPLNCGATILHQVVAMGDHVRPEERVAFATAALDAGARMDLRDDLLQSTALGWACRWGREELVRLFLGRGADPLEKDAEPWATPLAWAEKKGHKAVLAVLQAHLRSK